MIRLGGKKLNILLAIVFGGVENAKKGNYLPEYLASLNG